MSPSRAAQSVVLLSGCAGGSAHRPASPAGETPFVVDTVATGLEHPWSLAFLPDGGLLVTEKYGGLRRYAKGDTAGRVVRVG